MTEETGDEQKSVFKALEVDQAEKVYHELYETMIRTIGPWSTKKIFNGGPENFNREKPVECLTEVINSMSTLIGVKMAKKITLLALEAMQKEQENK